MYLESSLIGILSWWRGGGRSEEGQSKRTDIQKDVCHSVKLK